ncbi:MAG: hypothetical protein ACQKBY_08360 [Verrucomicrobiales bacterium]
MKILHHKLIAILSLSFSTLAPAKSPEIEHRILSTDEVHVVPVSSDHTTTISFPEQIGAIDGAFISMQADQPGLFQLSHTKGSSFFSVRCLSEQKEAQTNLNVRWKNHTYVLLLQQSSHPKFSIVFEEPPQPVHDQNRPQKNDLSPADLISLLDKAKAYPFLKEHHPNAVIDVKHANFKKAPQVSKQAGFEIHIEEVFRFERQDTLVFRLLLRNLTEDDIHYRSDRFSVRAGDHTYPQSISDGNGSLPAKTQSIVYLAITGTPYGGRNHLSPDNQFIISVDLEVATENATHIHPEK